MLFDGLVIASLVVSLFTILSQIGLSRKLAEIEVQVFLLMAYAALSAEDDDDPDDQEIKENPYFKGSDDGH